MKYLIEYQWSDGTVEAPTKAHEEAVAEQKARDHMVASVLAAGVMLDVDINPPRIVSWKLIPA